MENRRLDERVLAPVASLSRREAVRHLGIGGIAFALLTHGLGRAAAQDATPATSNGAVGISIQMLGAGPTSAAPGLELTLRRTTLAPGGRLPAHTHPGALVIFVESGAFGYTALGGTIQLTRATVDGTPSPPEAMPIGTEVILNPGDWVFVEDPGDDIRNAGQDDVVLLVAGLSQIGVPFTTFTPGMDMEGTPTS